MNYVARPAAVLALSFGWVAGCGDSTDTFPFADDPYLATTFIVTRTGESPQDVVAAGGQMSIVLHREGFTSGMLVVPASITDPEPAISADMAGTWVQTGNTIHFQQQADTFVRDATWTIGSGTLTTSFTEPGGTVEVTLTLVQPD